MLDLTVLKLSIKLSLKPCMIARPAGINSFRSYEIGPLCSLIQSAIPPTKLLTASHAFFKPPRKLFIMALPASARLKFLSELKIDLIELIMLEIDALALLIELTMVLQADFNVFIRLVPTVPKPSKPPFKVSITLLII